MSNPTSIDVAELRRAVLAALENAKANGYLFRDWTNEMIAGDLIAYDDDIASFAIRADYYALEQVIVQILEEPR
jgi:hypothetical protein